MNTQSITRVSKVGRIRPHSTAFFLCDVQDRFRDLISFFPSVIHVGSTMVKAADTLKIPVIVTEQNPRALGKTISEIDISSAKKFDKMKFSMVIPEVEAWLNEKKPETVIVCGIEAHVCVLQTTFDLIERGIDVHVLVDGVSSQRPSDRLVAFERMKQAGCFLTTMESILLQMLGSADHPNFKPISNLLKVKPPPSGIETVLGKL